MPYKKEPKTFSGFCIVYRTVNNDLRSMLIDCVSLKEALEIVTARGIPLKDLGAAVSIGKMASIYKEDIKRITYGNKNYKRKKNNGKPVQNE